MQKKYLLYIDILGFVKLVEHKVDPVIELFNIIDSLNVHDHYAFKAIVFSDTIIVYNKVDPVTAEDHRYISMYACEFAQDLLYRLINKNIYFRAILDYGEFEYKKLKNIEQYFGRALINCYLKEKKIPSIGLFITNEANQYQSIFFTCEYDSNIRFVYLQQHLYRIEESYSQCNESFAWEIEATGDIDYLAIEAEIMKDIYLKMQSEQDPNVRVKYQSYWLMYKKKCPWLLTQWENNGFDIKNIFSEKYK